MKYKFSILAFILMLSLSSNAQNISVKSFRMLPNDMDARVNFPKTDQNGEKCTIIKVVSTEQGFVWEGDALGIVDTKFKTSEYWLYVPRGAKRLTIKHPKLGMLRNYIYPLPIKEATVYEMVLTTGKLTTIVEEYEVPTQWVVITSKPEGADVFINEQYVGVAPYQAKMEIGSYNYRIEKSMYHSEAGKFELNETSRTELKVDLKPNFGYAKINTSPEQGASVEIDGKAINIVTPFTSEKLKSGQHKLKVKKVMFKPKTLNFTISDGQTTNLNIDLEPNFAEVTIKTNPEADIYIDDTKKGYGTVTTRLNPGLHTFEAKKDKHSSDKKQQGFAAGESVNLSLHPQAKTGKADIVSTPIDANIKLDGKNYGTTPTTLKNLLIGNYTLTLEKEGFGALTKNITISENQTLTINETLPADMPVTITSTPTGAQLIIDDKSHGATPQTVTLVFGNHNVKLVNGKKVVNEAINIAQNGRTSFSFDVSENTFTDKRDGKTYKTVKIGSQIWMAENLNYKTTDSYCYDNNEANCQKYGRLYTWKVAKSACPSGWHLPSKAEFETLLNNYGGENSAFVALKEGGNSGFNDLFGGFRKYGDHYNQGSRGYFWSSSEYNIFKAWYMNINSYNKKANMHYNSQSDCRSVRCVQD